MEISLEEMRATKKIIDKVIEKEEENEFKKKGYKEVIEPTREELNLKTVKEISKDYKIGESRIRELINSDRKISLNFPVLRVGKRCLIPESLFKEWLIEACRQGLRI
ncbi:hypothetical protein [Peptostreptococcus porci]|uniref:hypothetical protein n=1 Tax=Peptostreptococcus porci TaxID=2652282 RepID=UPI0023F349D4|nr:hypothetical protein [Peptostreptococcus porci]MDD7183292.1 hypothetical protein [Peptostreptococcus porci]MDY4127971.1 hypothetical protein [Peptostreptococcus porci]MDY4561808.1 hypothetical protein [Peptostreptococcus porci]